ncbi:MAG: GNAT family N-acetyltransferase [Armatimonadota bacterium]|nr:GNAT family N-acetyltransferase [Armatimonadota bacterium]
MTQETSRRPLRFLGPDASTEQLIRATAANHTQWMTEGALASGGEVCRADGVLWAYTPGPNGGADLPFPEVPSATASETLDAILAECRKQTVGRVGCWALTPTRPRDLGARLMARGFEWGWQPHWMALNLNALPADFPLSDGLRIAVDDEADWDVDNLPYYQRHTGNRFSPSHAAAHSLTGPRRQWHFGAWLDGEIAGHCSLQVTTGRRGVAGIYSMGVVPSARRKGIGRALTLAACRFAQARGCHWVTLNSAADDFYESIGFALLGWGQTWWMHGPALAAPSPTQNQIAFVEAVGRGNLQALDQLFAQGSLPSDLDAPLPNGMTAMEIAIQPGKTASAEWLAAHGATLEVIHAWDLGWKDRVPEMLAESPALANRRMGAWQITPLHEAVSRNDLELARLLLTARPDLTIEDAEFHSTALGWATHSGHTEMAALLEQSNAGAV